MSDNKRYCMGCMKPLEEQAILCPHCHYSTGMSNKPAYIKQGGSVADRYIIGKALAASNDSVIYIGLDKETEKAVTVYEFFPNKIASRDSFGAVIVTEEAKAELYDTCLQSFLGLWRGIRMFDDIKCIPHVTDIIRDNGTAYAIADHKDTVALKDYFAKTRKPLAASKAVAAFLPVINALKLLHNAGIIHGNITPSTIQVGADGRLNLIGFSIPQCRSDIPELAAKPVSGFSPIEVYQGSAARPQTDIYSLMAVMYYSVTGTVPARATERLENSKLAIPATVAQTMPASLTEAFSRALAVQPADRLGKADELIALLKGTKAPSSPVSAPVKATPAPAESTAKAPEYKAPSYDNEATVAFTAKEKEQFETAQQEEAPSAASRRVRGKAYAEPEEAQDKYNEEGSSEDSSAHHTDIPLPVLGALTCVAVVVICFILFVVSYATFLYKSIEVPVLDNMLSAITFLPMNKDAATGNNDIYGDIGNQDFDLNTQYVSVPDFTQYTEDEIRSNVNFTSNFEFFFKYEASETVAQNKIISQSYDTGTSVQIGTRITLVVSTGQPEIVVPDVYGKTYEEAYKILIKAGFTVKKEIVENTDGRIGNTVQTMSIEPGKGASKGTEIILFVWDEPIEETTEELTTEEITTTAPSTEPSTEPSTTPSTEPSTQESTSATTEPSTESSESENTPLENT